MLINKLYPGETDSSVMIVRNTRAAPFTLGLQIIETSGSPVASTPNLAGKVNLKVTSGGVTLLETQSYNLWKDPNNAANTARIPNNYKLYGNLWADMRDEADNGSLRTESERLYPVYPDEDTEIMGGLFNVNQIYSLGTFDNLRNLALEFEVSLIPETDNTYQGAEANFQVIFTVQTIPPVPTVPTEPPTEVTTAPTVEPSEETPFIGDISDVPTSLEYESTVVPPEPTSSEIPSTIEPTTEEYISEPEEEVIPEESIPLEAPPTESIPTTLGSNEGETEEIPEPDIPLSGLPVTGGIALTGILIAGIAFIVLGKVIEG